MFAAFQLLAIVSLSVPLHSIVSSITEHLSSSGGIESLSVSVAIKSVVLPQSSATVYVTVIVPPAPQVVTRLLNA